MTIGDILGNFKGISYVYIHKEGGLSKFAESDELRESELNSDFKWCEPSMYRGRYCLEFNL